MALASARCSASVANWQPETAIIEEWRAKCLKVGLLDKDKRKSALGYGWSWKSEFLYIDYGWTKFFDPADTCSPTCNTFLNPREVSLKNYVFRTGLNWRFDWGKAPVGKAPVAVMAKY
jgi:hypothetical protein